MSNEQNWSPQTTAGEYFQQNEKRLKFGERRASYSRAVDLVGPGINSYATRITDFDNELATFNGYFSAGAGEAINAPTDDWNLVGTVTSDAEFGGMQVFYPVGSGAPDERYERMFRRAPMDSEVITFTSWRIVTY